MPIIELRILPTLAIARLGASLNPLENFDFVPPANPLDLPTIKPAETLYVDSSNGSISHAAVPDTVRFRDGGAIRPVCPFLEVFARLDDDTLVPLTTTLLAAEGLTPDDVKWAVIVGNNKAYRRTGDEGDKITAAVTITGHDSVPLLGTAPNFFAHKALPLGHVRYIRPTEFFPEIRLRFTPAAGWVYGASPVRKQLAPDNKVYEEPDPILSPERIIYNPDKGHWRGYVDPPSGPHVLYETNPAQIYAGFSNADDNQESWGYLDDECDGVVVVAIERQDQEPLAAYARIGAGPPAFAPDRTPIRTVADELMQVLQSPQVAPGQATQTELQAAAIEIVNRAAQTVSLMNTAVMNGNTVQGRTNAASTMVRQDTNDFGRYYSPIMAPTSVDSKALLALHQSVIRALAAGTGAWFAGTLRQPEQIGDLSDLGRRRMPALMRGADGRNLALTRRQIDTIAQAVHGTWFAGPAEEK
jgi:hypothetical protein